MTRNITQQHSTFWRRTQHFVVMALFATLQVLSLFAPQPVSAAPAITPVPGQSYMICDQVSQFLTSPWTYHALASGSQTYTVSQYQALPGYGTTLPPLPSYISGQGASAPAAVIYAPGSSTDNPAYEYPNTPLLHFFEGGTYASLSLNAVNGSLYIGGSAPGFPSPKFNNGGGVGGINAQNDSYGFQGIGTTLTATATAGATTVSIKNELPWWQTKLTFSDGATYDINTYTATTVTLNSPITNTYSAGSQVWSNTSDKVATITAGATQGATTVTLSASNIPLMPFASITIGDHTYGVSSVSGSQSGYTVTLPSGGLDVAVAANTPVFYGKLAGAVTVQYLDINNDQHNTTGTIYTGQGWTVSHNNIHDGYSTPGMGVAVYGGDESVIEYNCFSRMGVYAVNLFGHNAVFHRNEVFETNYNVDPGCGCSGGGKWWGTLNADITENAFIRNGIAGGVAVWLDNGNTGTLISGNYFDQTSATAVHLETGHNAQITNNLFKDGGWGDGTGGCGNNCIGAVNINSNGGMTIPGSRYQNQVLVSGNQFINNWSGVNIWQSGARSCENSGQGWPNDDSYCAAGYPVVTEPTANGQYYFSHIADSRFPAGYNITTENATAGSTTLMTSSAMAINDRIGFSDPAETTTTSTTNVTSFAGTGVINADTTGFPNSGQLRVGTSAAWSDGGGSYTGAILSYTGKTASTFTGVSYVRGSGTLTGPVIQIQPYTVTSQTCYANNCKVTISPALTAEVGKYSQMANSGTCQMYAVPGSLPSGPLAPNGVSYWEGCQWMAKHITITGNTFMFQPSYMADKPPITGGSTVCTNANPNSCGTNFMQFQLAGQDPFSGQTAANAMMSNSTFTGCPAWDAGCSTNPLANINALTNPPGAPAGNGAGPGENIWTNNTYIGPWGRYAYLFGGCSGAMPTDSTTGHTMPDVCTPTFSSWQGNLQQDAGSTSTAVATTLEGVTANQDIHGVNVALKAYTDTSPSAAFTGRSLKLSSTTLSNLTASPQSHQLNTAAYANGAYNVIVTGTNSAGQSDTTTVPVYITNGDFNGDGKVSILDLSIMARYWGQTDSNYYHGNITGQTTINISSLSVLSANYGWIHP